VGAALALTASPALAQRAATTPASVSPAVREARERFERGVELADAGNYGAAMVEFQRAYELTHNPLVLFNISATHEALGHFVEALDAMLQYAAQAPAATVAQRRQEIDAAIARLQARVGTIEVAVDVPGLEVLVDGLSRPTAVARQGLRVSAGRHRVVLSAPGYRTREVDVDVAGGATVRVTEAPQPNESTLAVETNVPGAEVVVDGRVVARTPMDSPVRVTEGPHHVEVRRPGYTTYATDVLAVGTGARVTAQLGWASSMPPGVASRLVVRANLPGVVATVDGQRIGLEGTEPLPPGAHRLRVERTDHMPVERDVELPPGRVMTADVVLVPTPGVRANRIDGVRTAGWIVTASGGAAFAGGLVWFLVNRSTLSDDQMRFNQLDPVIRSGRYTPSERTEYEHLRDEILPTEENYQLASAILTGVGLAGALTGLGIALAAPLTERSPTEPAVRFQVAARGVVVTLGF
jgi:hypothetical protein